MGSLSSLEVESQSNGKPQHLFGQSGTSQYHGSSSSSNARLYFILCLAFFTLYGLLNMTGPADQTDAWASTGDAAGGWGSEHNHAITHYDTSLVSSQQKESSTTFISSYSPANLASIDLDNAFLTEDFEIALKPILVIPSHARREYEHYQAKGEGYQDDLDISELLHDKNTAHGMAFDFILNRDKRRIRPEDPQLVQRFVLALFFYATGGIDMNNPEEISKDNTRGGWDSELAHFLTGLHECHWVKKSLRDQFWELLSMEGDDDRKVGVTKCNDDMEVTEIRLADLNLVGFIPEEIKWLSNLESLDVQNNHLAGPIPQSLGELDELRYLSLDGNNFSGSIPDVFYELTNLERAYLNFNDFNGAMPPSLCTLREDGSLTDLWSDCGGYPITCTCCTVCCDMVAECDDMRSQNGA
ncbi:hypothetical protein HJC23_002534 [Cyclotella cryptica]|uniref:L domain-like protein n=1 Tax=Cyclotella cryptica TaxID=29204 RepID=A0ABD3R397_9STRA|eukprot:CCRYP_001386-RB/>CCRYP_001386-RB protein AED:0.06 eAED:0.06 QI:133/1/1/1/0.6/0.5/6/1094/412